MVSILPFCVIATHALQFASCICGNKNDVKRKTKHETNFSTDQRCALVTCEARSSVHRISDVRFTRIFTALSHEHSHDQSRDSVPTAVSDHSGPQTFSYMREDAECHPEERDDDHSTDSLVPVARSEDDSGEHDSYPRVASPRTELPLQVAAEDNFFAQSRGRAQAEEDPHFEVRSWSEEPDLPPGIFQLACLPGW